MEENSELVNGLIREGLEEGYITCPECKEIMEIEEPVCKCGWKNPLVEMGLV